MLVPILRPGSIVQVDDSRRKIVNSGWLTEYHRPIYFLELRYSYECGWCYQRGKEVMLLPRPLSPAGPQTIRIPDDGEVLAARGVSRFGLNRKRGISRLQTGFADFPTCTTGC